MWAHEQQHLTSPSNENREEITKTTHGKWYGPNTPHKQRRACSSLSESPRLCLSMFANTPRISFGKVKIGRSRTKRVVIENPLSIAQCLHLNKWPEDKGFKILQPVEHGEECTFTDTLHRDVEFVIPGFSEMDLPIVWTPTTEGSFREVVTLNLGDFNRLNLILFGSAFDTTVKQKPKMKILLPEDMKRANGHFSTKRKMCMSNKQASKKVPPKRILKENNAGLPKPTKTDSGSNHGSNVENRLPMMKDKTMKGESKMARKFKAKVSSKGVAPSHLNLTKHLTTERNLPRHPLPYAAKNMYYDEKWTEKQERGFTQWLNYVLTPPDELGDYVQPTCSSSGIFSVNDVYSREQHLAPTKEELSLRAYTARRKMSRVRRSACLLFQSQPFAIVAKTIESEVEMCRLAIRSDKHLHQDLGIKESMLKMLLSYNALWLRIGLETIYGEVLPVQSNDDVLGIRKFLKRRFLANPDVALRYRHATVAEVYRPGYYEALNKFTLKKFLLLILFLDKAKLSRLIDHDPCLFNKDAEFKSSRMLLLAFSRDYLKGEGDITKHLGLLNYVVTHEQTPLDEMDYAVTNLAIDLRDGVRITRVIELLTQQWFLTGKLRVPAISRLQKIHNVDIALSALKERRIISDELNSVNPRHIVDGHREKTLCLLWVIILHFQVNLVVNEKQIRDEIQFLKKYYDQRNPNLHKYFINPSNDVYNKSEKLALLLTWCQSVCRLFNVKVDNFTVSMSDGRAMCYLVHYYHPRLLREEEICQETTQTRNPYILQNNKCFDDDSLNSDNDSCHKDSDSANFNTAQLKENEKRNFELLQDKVKALGDLPRMLKFKDISCTLPDEKVIITYISYLCARLLDLRLEGRAARVIQMAWRKYFRSKQLIALKRRNYAACVIQKHARLMMQRKQKVLIFNSARIIQAYVRGFLVRRNLHHRHQAVNIIRTCYLSYRVAQKTRQHFKDLRMATLRLQSLYRGKMARRHVEKIRAARIIQSRWLSYLTRREF